VHRDKRQIQTAVLGSADSEEPLTLPLEAIELDAFRRRHQHDTYWCGLLLGGCGAQLATKLYTDRVCHFAHHPGPDGAAHQCGRRARGISSADHLYVKSAAAAWLHGSDARADIAFTQPDGALIGSVVDIDHPHGRLRVHLNQEVDPVWDEDGWEPVLGVSVPVSRDTLIDRWYVHRIRLDSQDTTRRVRIGTEAFARPTEWFALDECEMTERGLTTPAVARIIRSRTTRPPTAAVSAGREKSRKAPDPQARAQMLLRQLADARKVESAVVVTRLCEQITALTGTNEKTQAQLTTAIADARSWLGQQTEVRRSRFSELEAAVSQGHTQQVRALLSRVNATASHDRTEDEDRIADAAADYLTNIRSAAIHRVHGLLGYLRRRPRGVAAERLRPDVQEMLQAAAEAGRLDPRQEAQIAAWKVRAGLDKPAPAVARSTAAEQRPPRHTPSPLHKQVARRHWIKRSCPRCKAGSGRDCVFDDKISYGQKRNMPHDERLQPIVDERKQRQKEQSAASRPWRVYEVTCPDCGQGTDERCKTAGGPHHSRVQRAREYTRLKRPRPQPPATT
jgi:hypothetical protein